MVGMAGWLVGHAKPRCGTPAVAMAALQQPWQLGYDATALRGVLWKIPGGRPLWDCLEGSRGSQGFLGVPRYPGGILGVPGG